MKEKNSWVLYLVRMGFVLILAYLFLYEEEVSLRVLQRDYPEAKVPHLFNVLSPVFGVAYFSIVFSFRKFTLKGILGHLVLGILGALIVCAVLFELNSENSLAQWGGLSLMGVASISVFVAIKITVAQLFRKQ